MIVCQRITIARPIAPVYDAFADLPRWCHILPDTLAVRLLYFDGYNQEFTMTVARPDGPETVRGIRYCRPPVELELFQPQPPPGIKTMAGRWHFTEQAGQTTVVATRHFHLLPTLAESVGAEAAFAEKLGQLLAHNLTLFKEALERDGTPDR